MKHTFTYSNFSRIFIIPLMVVFSLLFSNQISAQELDLMGTYTIDPAGGAFDPGVNDNFASFSEALDSLIARGVGGAVTINVADGLYDESYIITAIPGASAANMITFQSTSQDSSKVYLNYSGFTVDNKMIFHLNGASYITFKHLGFDATNGSASYGQAFYLNGGTNHIYFENNSFVGKPSGYTSYNDDRALILGWQDNIAYIEARNNRFTNGEVAVKISGTDGALGAIIEDNICIDQNEAAIYLREQDAPVIRNNEIRILNVASKTGIYLEKVDKGFQVYGNRIDMNNCYAGIYIYDSDGNPGDEGMVYNNLITNNVSSSGYNNAIWVYQITNTKFYHNSINIFNLQDTDSRAFYQESTGSSIDLQNNNFVNQSGGYAIQVNSATAISKMDHNNYFTNGNFLARWVSAELPTLSDLQTSSEDDAASVSVNPVYFDDDDMHTTNYRIDNLGADLSTETPNDFDGVARSATPDIGAFEFTGAGAPLSGEYFVGGSSPDYATLEAAAKDLNELGISGPTIFSIRDDDSPYTSSLVLGPISGSSVTNTVTFRPDPANTGDVILTHSGTADANQTIYLLRTSNVIIEDLTLAADNSTYSTILRLDGYCENLVFNNNVFNSLGTNSNNASIFSIDDMIIGLDITNNTFTGGVRGVDINGLSNTSYQPADLVISNNSFLDHYYGGVYLRDCTAPKILENIAESGPTSYNFWGFALQDCYNDYEIIGNKVIYNGDDGGIYIYSCESSSTFRGKVINNYLDMTEGTYTANGIYSYTSTYVDFYFNTSRIHSGNTSASSNAFYNYSGSNLRIKNNNFANFGKGRAYYNETASAITESDYNNIFSAGTYLARWGGSEQNTLADWQTVSTMDANSLSINPWFLNPEDPEINSSYLDGSGVAISGITEDYFGDLRSDPPDIGAAEFTASTLPLETGTYTIGGTTPDYPTIVEALADVQLRGIAGSIVFSIRSGDYDEHIGTVNKIPGSSAENTITITSETGNAEDVRIFKVTDNVGGPFNIFNFKSVDYLTIENLTVSSLGTTGGRPLSFEGNYRSISVRNMILTSSNTSDYCLYLEGSFDNVSIENNLISGGYGGLYSFGLSNDYGSDNSIVGNTITGGRYYGINLRYQYAPVLVENTIEHNNSYSFDGIVLSYCSDEIILSGNKVNASDGGTGINITNCNASNPFFGLVSNNMIHIGGTYTAYGIYIDYSSRIFLYNNSVNVSSTHASYGTAGYIRQNNSEIQLINNVFANTGTGYAMTLDQIADVTACDYNDLYSAGENLIYSASTSYTDLAGWKSYSSLDAHSLSVDPLYYTASDLHSMQVAFHQAAQPLSSVTHDIDSVLRDTQKPDLGAAEFSCVSPEFNVYVSQPCLGDTTIIIDSSLYIAPGSTRGWDMNGDLVADVYTTKANEEIKWLFDDAEGNSITYIVTQIAGCNDFTTEDVVVTPSPVLELSGEGAYCGAADGVATVTVTNLEGPFDYFWSNGSKESVADNLEIGTYTVAVSTKNGCISNGEVVIGEAIEITFSDITPSTCGEEDGEVTVTVVGGEAPYTYAWSNDVTEATNTTLPPGLASVRVTDSNGCDAVKEINMVSVGGPQISLESITNNDCYSDELGSINLSVSGGLEPYDIQWSNGEQTEDIDHLGAGVYNVVIEDAAGCVGSGSFQISQPALIKVSPLITPSSCGGADGIITAIVSGGTKPYNYEWTTGSVTPSAENLEAGVYSVTVTDNKGCQIIEPVVVNNIDAPVVTITDVQGVGCTISNNGSISASASPANPFYSYSWSNGETTPNISGLEAGEYVLKVTDEVGCEGVAQAVIKQEPPEVNPICMVTVDTLTGMNMILWDKLVQDDVSHYNIYRESSVKNEYLKIDSVLASEFGEYIDLVADPKIHSWRYKISVVDACGNESELSEQHKTMHLTLNVGLNDAVNLIWDNYEGFDLTTFNVWRFAPSTGWVQLESIAAGKFTYTDDNPPNEDLTYQIEIEAPGSCTSSQKKPSTLNVSRSNRKSKKSTSSVHDMEGAFANLNIYPNPGNGQYHLDLVLDRKEDIDIKVYDISGKVVFMEEYKDYQGTLKSKIDLSEYSDGTYNVQIRTTHNIYHRLLIKEN